MSTLANILFCSTDAQSTERERRRATLAGALTPSAAPLRSSCCTAGETLRTPSTEPSSASSLPLARAAADGEPCLSGSKAMATR